MSEKEIKKIADPVEDDIRDKIVKEAIIPGVKELVFNTVTGVMNIIAGSIIRSLNIKLFDDDRPVDGIFPFGGGGKGNSKTNYRKISEGKPSTASTRKQDYRYKQVSSMAKGREVLAQMMEVASDEYGACTISEYLTMFGETPDWGFENWGWSADDIAKGDVKSFGIGKWYIVLPQPRPIASIID